MKLLENMEELGGSIHEAIKNLVEEMFNKQLEDTQVAEIVSRLKLSEILQLDHAYTQGNKDEIAKILGNDLVEYSYGQGRNTTSAASERPVVQKRDQSGNAKTPTTTKVKPTQAYSTGVQNGVTTKNIDHEDDMQQTSSSSEEEIEESHDTMPDGWAVIGIDHHGNEKRVAVTEPHKKQEAEDFVARLLIGMKAGTTRGGILQGYVDARIEPYFNKTVEEAGGIMDMHENNVVNFLEELKKRSGI